MTRKSVFGLAAALTVGGAIATAFAADGCNNDCFDFSFVKMPGQKCSKYSPLSQAHESGIFYSSGGFPDRDPKADGMNVTKYYRECADCDLLCPDSTPTYAFSTANSFILDDPDDCEDVHGPFQRTICKDPPVGA